MNNLVDIQNQIQKLQKQASEIKDREFGKTVQDILAKMQAFGISVKDLQAAMAGGRKGRGKAKTASAQPKVADAKKKKRALQWQPNTKAPMEKPGVVAALRHVGWQV